MDLEAMQQAITRAMAANAEAAILAMHGFPRNDAVCHLCMVAENEMQEVMRIIAEIQANIQMASTARN